MDWEEGEIFESTAASSLAAASVSVEGYDPSYEWPDESLNSYIAPTDPSGSALASHHSTRKLKRNQPSFRLLAIHSSILPPKQKLAIVDGYSELQFGRDIVHAGSLIPKIRLKEMAVSKLHATAYWDTARREWAVVDMGSMHGTFLQPAATLITKPGVRLSPSRVASVPRRLQHMDRLTIGGTSFLIHLHEDQLPCETCSPNGGDEIPLFPLRKVPESVSMGRPKGVAGLDSDASFLSSYAPKSPRDPKKALTMLKHSLLTRHDVRDSNPRSSSPGDATAQYTDRSARRRALHPASRPDAPGVSSPLTDSPRLSQMSPSVEPVVVSQVPTPLPTSNIGHRLLVKQGWEPGTALGASIDPNSDRIGLMAPLEVSSSMHRAGLGIKRTSSSNNDLFSDLNWKENAKRQRWDNYKSDEA